MKPVSNIDHQLVQFPVGLSRVSSASGHEDASAEPFWAALNDRDFNPVGYRTAERWANLGSAGAYANQAMRVG